MGLLRECATRFAGLQKKYKKRGVVLFLGSGISLDCGLPTWCELTKRVFARVDQGEVALDLLEKRGCTEPAKLMVAKGRLKDDFFPVLRGALYRDLRFPDADEPTALREAMRAMNPTLAAIAHFLCQPNGADWEPNQKVPAILTTNVDTLLTSYVRKAYPSVHGLVRNVERASAGPQGNRVPIYYLHGMFNADPSAKLDKEAPDRAVFTETDYYLAYRDSLSVFSYTPSFLFREHTILFVGTGLDDPNIRRLLCWSQSEIATAYGSEGKELPPKKEISHYALLRSVPPDRQQLTEELLKPLGVAVLWIEKFLDLPDVLESLRRADADAASPV